MNLNRLWDLVAIKSSTAAPLSILVEIMLYSSPYGRRVQV